MSVTKIQQWVSLVFNDSDLNNYNIEIEGQTGKGDGYGSDITFIKVSGFTRKGDQKTLHLAIKSSKNSERIREAVPMNEVFAKEIYIYQVVKKEFLKMLQERNVDNCIEMVPHCYGSCITDTNEVIVFENLRTKGFELWDKTQPMTPKHVQLILEAYGRWHALSFALKVQKPEVFQRLTQNNVNMFSLIADVLKFNASVLNEFENTRKLIIDESETDLKKLLEYSPEDVLYSFRDMFLEEPDYHVILHGDCWNNNYLFKCLDGKENPSELRVLDWQCSGLATPAMDLSHFFYACADSVNYEHPHDFLKIYYDSLSRTLRSLDCDPEAVYPFEKLVEHWKRFSRFGLFISCLVVRICLMRVDDIPDYTETADKGGDVTKNFYFAPTNDAGVLQRIRNNFRHYCRSLEE